MGDALAERSRGKKRSDGGGGSLVRADWVSEPETNVLTEIVLMSLRSDLNMVHHLWQFADLEERRARREQSWSVPGWGETVHKTVPLIQTMKSRIMVPMPWSAIG